MNSRRGRAQRGFILLPVVLALGLVATVAFLLNRESAIEADMTMASFRGDVARYVAEAGLRHELWQVNQAGCSGYADLPATSFGAHTYSASVTPTEGSPVAITATGTLADGTTRTYTRQNLRVLAAPVTTTLQPGPEGKDAYLNEQQAEDNYGASFNLRLKQNKLHTLLEFDLSAIPNGAAVTSAQLELKLAFLGGGAGGVEVNAHRVTRHWEEGTGDGSDTDDGASWESYDGNDSNPWDTPGGDYDTAVAGSATLGPLLGWYTWDLTFLVNAWVNGGYPNHGLLLRAIDAGDLEITSGDGGNPADRPKLTVTYSSAECAPPSSEITETLAAVADTYVDGGQPHGSEARVRVGPRLAGGSPGWTAQNSGTGASLRSVHFPVDRITGYAVGSAGTIRKTTDAGSSWSAQASGTTRQLQSVHFPLDATTGYAVGYSGTIRKTTDAGSSWSAQASGTTSNLHSVHFPLDATTGYAVGDSGTIRKTTDGGSSWSAQFSGTTSQLFSVHFPVDATTGYAVGQSGTILKTTNGGASWSGQPSGTTSSLSSVHFPVDATTGYAVGSGGVILKTTDGGASWSTPFSLGSGWLQSVHFPVDATTGYAAGQFGPGEIILKTSDGGATWNAEPTPSPSAFSLSSVHFPVDAIAGYAVGTGGSIRERIGGAVSQETLHPTGNGSVNGFSTATGCPSGHWDCVNDQPGNAGTGSPVSNDGTSSYLEDASGLTNREMFSLPDGTLPGDSTISAIQVFAQVGKGAGPPRTARLSYQRIGTDASPVDGPTDTVSAVCCDQLVSWTWAGLDWTPSDLDSLEIGIEHVSGGAVRLSQIYVVVTYDAPATALARFDVLSAIPPGVTILSAVLRLYEFVQIGNQSYLVDAHRITQTWTESGADWQTADGSTPWSGGDGGSYDPVAIDSTTVKKSAGWREWDLTPLVQEWVDGFSPDHGVQLIHRSASDGNRAEFHSKEGVAGNLPELVVTYVP